MSKKEFIIFTTRDYANTENLSMSAASKRLSRLKDKKFLVRITKGIWANVQHPYFNPLSCVPLLLNNEQGYVSFLTMLHLHDLISQIPKTIQIATTGHSRTLSTPVAQYEFLQIKPELMLEGVIWSETQLPYLHASVEKSLFDVLYIATRKNRRFSRLPELTLTHNLFNKKEFKLLCQRMALPSRIINAIQQRAEVLKII